MNQQLDQLATYILADIWPNYQDFAIEITEKNDSEITVGCWEGWITRTEENRRYPLFTIRHDGTAYAISKWAWSDRKPYKTLRGAQKYVHDEIVGYCNSRREHRDKIAAEKKLKAEGRAILQDLHKSLTDGGIKNRLYLTDDRYPMDHIGLDTGKFNISIDISVTSDMKTEIYFRYPRIYTSPERAKELIPLL